jgi:hypothetical protein
MSQETETAERTAWANSVLPQMAHSSKADPLSLCYTIIAEPKFGKTTWACSIPDALLLAFEQGHAFIEAHKVIIDAWDYPVPESRKLQPWDEGNGLIHMTFMQAVDIITTSDRFPIVVVDTADMAGKMCLDYHLKKNNLTHPQDWDFGKGHDVCLNTPFRQAFGRILKSGRGVIFITHTNTTDSRFAGATKSKKECTLPSGISKFLIPQSDVILHGRFGPRDSNKRRTRVFQTEGSDEVLAGARGVGQQYNLPPRFIINQEDPWAQWTEFFNDEEAASRASIEYETLVRGAKQAQMAEAPDGTEVKTVTKPKREPKAK